MSHELHRTGVLSVLSSNKRTRVEKTVSVRILLVDDFEPFLSFAAFTLSEQSGFQIVGKASDGHEAVKMARKLQPDLVVLDVGLPKLNGIEAARQIRSVSPNSKILFVTGNECLEIARDALNAGACGYVVKQDAARELLAAAKTVLSGNQYVSRRLVWRQ